MTYANGSLESDQQSFFDFETYENYQDYSHHSLLLDQDGNVTGVEFAG